MIDSMTNEERTNPKSSTRAARRRRAKGSGRPPKEVLELLKKFIAMRQMMGSLGKNLGLFGKIPGMGGLAQLNNMRKMALRWAAAAACQGAWAAWHARPGRHGDGIPGMDFGAGGQRKPVDRDKFKKLRKDAKKARKKNRKK